MFYHKVYLEKYNVDVMIMTVAYFFSPSPFLLKNVPSSNMGSYDPFYVISSYLDDAINSYFHYSAAIQQDIWLLRETAT